MQHAAFRRGVGVVAVTIEPDRLDACVSGASDIVFQGVADMQELPGAASALLESVLYRESTEAND